MVRDKRGKPIQNYPIHYLEVVTPDVDAVCAAHAASSGAGFGEPVAELGGARTADLADGMTLGVRAPMHEAEEPTTRPYFLVSDILQAVAAAKQAGAVVAVPPMEIPGRGQCAVLMVGIVQFGYWQL